MKRRRIECFDIFGSDSLEYASFELGCCYGVLYILSFYIHDVTQLRRWPKEGRVPPDYALVSICHLSYYNQ